MHIGIIPDGNRRWAKERRATTAEAYSVGFCNVIDVTLRLVYIGVEQITFFGLSHDNYVKRPAEQIEDILSHIIDSTLSATALFKDYRIGVRFFGQLDDLKDAHRDNLAKIVQTTTADVQVATLNMLVNYRPDWDLDRRLGFQDTSQVPPCDLIFRSGRANRLSGFLPLQSTNANLYFSSTLWPDVLPEEVVRIVRKEQGVLRIHGA